MFGAKEVKHIAIEANINLPENCSADKIKLFVRSPFDQPIKSVLLNGETWKSWDRLNEVIDLPKADKTIKVIVTY